MRQTSFLGVAIGVATALLIPRGSSRADQRTTHCPDSMVVIDSASCIDPFEGHLEDIDDQGTVLGVHSPYLPVAGKPVRAVSSRGVVPQAYISQSEALAACKASQKRLCTDKEWMSACSGDKPKTLYPYGQRHRDGYCNDAGTEALPVVFPGKGIDLFRLDRMNDPRLDKVEGSLAETGSFTRCRGDREVFDMVGNLHEWTADPEGTMRGGYFLDTESLGQGCQYSAVGHDTLYRDYSTGFRCCADSIED